MPAHPWYTNFTAGTVTEKLDSRTDFAKYANAARVLKNAVVLPQGGAASRAGTIYLGNAKFTDTRCRLVTFQFSVEQSYIVEFGVNYARFWTDRALVMNGANPEEVVTPYLESDLREMRFEQSADVMYLAHVDHPPAKISRVTTTDFVYDPISFLPYPSHEPREILNADIVLSQVTPGVATVTASASVFLAGDVGRQIIFGAGRAVITAVGSGTSVTVRILDTFSSATIASGDWVIDGSPNFGQLSLTAQTPRFAPVVVTSTIDTFRPTDVGKYIYVYDGIIEIKGYTSATEVDGQILRKITANITPSSKSGSGDWTLELPSWSAALGYPGTVCLFQGRLWWAGSPSFPDFVWASVVSDYENHARGPLDSDAIVYQMAMSGVNLIRWMKPNGQKGLGLGSIASEITIQGATDTPITPSNAQIDEKTHYGSDYTVDGLKIDSQVIFLQRAARRLREFAYKFTEDTFTSPDISILAENLFQEAIVEMAYLSTPESVIFAVRGDGLMNLCTYERAQNVVAWTFAETFDGDDFESVAYIPNSCGSGDEMWTAVRRQIHGDGYWGENYHAADYWAEDYWAGNAATDFRSIEVFDGAMNVDAGLTYSGAPASTFTGLDHLEARVARVVVDDGTEYNLTVSGGQVALPSGVTTTTAEIGLPWTMTLVTVRPDIQIPNGTIQGRRKSWKNINVRVYCTKGDVLLNSETMQYPEELDPAVTGTPFSGDMRQKTDFGWERNGFIVIQRAQAKPVTVTGIAGALEVADD